MRSIPPNKENPKGTKAKPELRFGEEARAHRKAAGPLARNEDVSAESSSILAREGPMLGRVRSGQLCGDAKHSAE